MRHNCGRCGGDLSTEIDRETFFQKKCINCGQRYKQNKRLSKENKIKFAGLK